MKNIFFVVAVCFCIHIFISCFFFLLTYANCTPIHINTQRTQLDIILHKFRYIIFFIWQSTACLARISRTHTYKHMHLYVLNTHKLHFLPIYSAFFLCGTYFLHLRIHIFVVQLFHALQNRTKFSNFPQIFSNHSKAQKKISLLSAIFFSSFASKRADYANNFVY